MKEEKKIDRIFPGLDSFLITFCLPKSWLYSTCQKLFEGRNNFHFFFLLWVYWTVVLKAHPLPVSNHFLGEWDIVVVPYCYIHITPKINSLKQPKLLLHHFCTLGTLEWLGWWIWARISWVRRHQSVSRGNSHLKATLGRTQIQFH